MIDKLSITQWIAAFKAGQFSARDTTTQVDAGWYDWFCNSSSLRNKTYKLAPKVIQMAKILGPEFCDIHYVWFKNNCPMVGSLYDDFRFANMVTSGVVYNFVPRSGHKSLEGRAEVWGKSNNFDKALASGKWSDVVKYMKTVK